LTFNSHDMRGGAVELGKWLKPGAPFILKIRRNDVTRVIRGTLAKRPPNWDQKMTVVLSTPEIWDNQSGSVSRVPQQRVGVMKVRQPMPAPAPLQTVLAPAFGYGSNVYPFAGAEFTALNEDLSDVLGVRGEGVFVTSVIDGSPARASGLRGGDIILRANNIKLQSPLDLVQAIKTADDGDRTIVLLIMRKHKVQPLTLRW
jgi:membrane-associated protease RseP (regulator of RpoE activity)